MSSDQPKSKKRWLLYTIGLLLIVIVLLYNSIPYENAATARLRKMLEAKGFVVTSIKVDHLNSRGAEVSVLELGGEQKLKVGYLKAAYSLKSLMNGRISGLVAKDTELNIYKKDDKFMIGGLESILGKKPDTNKNSTAAIADINYLQKTVPVLIDIKNTKISGKDENWEFNLPLDISFTQKPETNLTIDSQALNFKAKPYELCTGIIGLKAALDKDAKKWNGTAEINNITITGLPSEIPVTKLTADYSLTDTDLLADININNEKNTVKGTMQLTAPIKDISNGNLNIKEMQFPWGGGVISTNSVNVSLGMKKPIAVTLNLKEVNLAEALGKVSEGKVSGTGKISGSLPLIYNPDGTITLLEGGAQAIDNGVISVSPTLIPGDNAQVDLARKILENFHYTKLKISVSSEGERSAINLALEGRNPDSTEERPINFNINLTGDILPLIQQSILPFNDVKKLLQEETK